MQFESDKLPGDILCLTLTGRLDIAGTQTIEQQFSFTTTAKAQKIIVDLSGVTFLVSVGIRLLLTSARAQARRGGKMVLVAPPSLVSKVLETAGVNELVAVFPDLAAAQASLAG